MNQNQQAAPAVDVSDVELLCSIAGGLTQWEVQFAEDMKRKVVQGGHPLTPRQREALDRILERFGL